MPETEITDKQAKDLTYIALLTIASGDDGVIPEILFLIDNKDFMRLVNAFSGRYIRIPAKDELIKALKTVKYYHDVEIKGDDPAEVCKRYHIDNYNHRWLISRIKNLQKFLVKNDYELPNEYKNSEFLVSLVDSLCKR